MTEWEAGTIVADRYRLVSKLGQGGMGEVWRAMHLGLNAPVAVKRVQLDDSEEARGRFLREAQASAVVRGPNLVQVLDYGVDDDVPYIAMELLEGESLAERIEREGALPPEEVAWIIADVARGIGRAHKRQIIHRDLKPGNVFLVADDDGDYAKILDFGIAKTLPASDATTLTAAGGLTTKSGMLLGTPFYMSPEQLDESELVDHHADLWALSVIAFECLTGERPFQAESIGKLVLDVCSRPIPVPSEVAPVPEGFDAWFARGTERNPEARFQSAQELIDSLEEVLLDEVPSRRLRPSSHGDGRKEDLRGYAPTEPARTNSGITTSSQGGSVRPATPWIAGLAVALVAAGGFLLSSSDESGRARPGLAPLTETLARGATAAGADASSADEASGTGTATPSVGATATPSASASAMTSASAEVAAAPPRPSPPRTPPEPPPAARPAPPSPPSTAKPPPPAVDLGI